MKLIFRVFGESIKLTLQQLFNNKLRTFLSLFGITIGIFSIISILTAVDALKNNINNSINSLGDNVLFVNKWAWTFDGPNDYPWWKYFSRPIVKYENYKYVKSKIKQAEYIAFEVNPRKSPEVAYKDKKTYKAVISAVNGDYDKVFNLDIEYGRFFSPMESANGINICVIGGDIVQKFFSNATNPIGMQITIDGRKCTIVGTIKKKGEDLLGFNYDKAVIIPYTYFDKNFSYSEMEIDNTIEVKTKTDVTLAMLQQEIIGIMRSARKLRPTQVDDFSINQLSVIAKGFSGMFESLDLVGIIIGLFAVLVGGFGIANIMYVSVTERVSIIGVKRALGAKKKYILFEFLIESIILCLIGGLIGLILVFFLAKFLTAMAGMDFVLTFKNATIGIVFSIVIGLLAGILPAKRAANLDPVEAIRSK